MKKDNKQFVSPGLNANVTERKGKLEETIFSRSAKTVRANCFVRTNLKEVEVIKLLPLVQKTLLCIIKNRVNLN